MEIKFNLMGQERKKLAQAVSELLDAPISYKGAPTFAYSAGNYSIDKGRTLTGPDNWELVADLSGLHSLVPTSKIFDIEPEPITDDAPPIRKFRGSLLRNPDFDYNAEGPHASDCEEQNMLTIEMPLDGFTEQTIANLEKLVTSKATLIKKAIGATALPVDRTDTLLQFPWFSSDANGDEVAAYTHFIAALCKAAKEQKRISATEKAAGNEKFAFRVFLIRLGFVGDGFKKARKILLRNLSGNTAYRDGRPAVKEACAQ